MNRTLLISTAALAVLAPAFVTLGADCDTRPPYVCAASGQSAYALTARQKARKLRRQQARAATVAAAAAAQPVATVKDPRAPLRLPEPTPTPDPRERPIAEDARLAQSHVAFASVTVASAGDQALAGALFAVTPRPVATMTVIASADPAPVAPVEAGENLPPLPNPMPSVEDWANARMGAIVTVAGMVAAVAVASIVFLFIRLRSRPRAATQRALSALGTNGGSLNVWNRIRTSWNNRRLARKLARERIARNDDRARARAITANLPDGQVWARPEWRVESDGRVESSGPLGASPPDDSAIGEWARSLQANESEPSRSERSGISNLKKHSGTGRG